MSVREAARVLTWRVMGASSGAFVLVSAVTEMSRAIKLRMACDIQASNIKAVLLPQAELMDNSQCRRSSLSLAFRISFSA